jgi:hypothetical protein
VPAAVKLANLDGITSPTPAQVAEYQQALTTLDKGCGGTDEANAALVYATGKSDAKDGVGCKRFFWLHHSTGVGPSDWSGRVGSVSCGPAWRGDDE